MLELPDIFFKYLFLFEAFSFGILSFIIPLYRRINKESKKITKVFFLNELNFVNLKKGYTTKFPIVNSYFMCLMIFNTILSIICLTSLSFIWLPIIFIFASILFIGSHKRITFYEDFFLVKYLYKKDVRFYYTDLSRVYVRQAYKKAILIDIIFKDSHKKRINFDPAYWYRDRELISIILSTKVNSNSDSDTLDNLNENDF